MFEGALKGTKIRKAKSYKVGKVKKWKPFMSGGEASRWKKEGSPQNMLKLTRKVK